MAQQARVELIDKIDGGTGNETITFGLDEATDEIDLSECDAADFLKSLADFVDHAERAQPPTRLPTADASPPAPSTPTTARTESSARRIG